METLVLETSKNKLEVVRSGIGINDPTFGVGEGDEETLWSLEVPSNPIFFDSYDISGKRFFHVCRVSLEAS